ncbi:hypothetical protein ACHAPU_011068 [Fusarium lateritium]
MCVHNPRRRSGRPSSTNNLPTNGPRDADTGSSQGLNMDMDFCADTLPQNWSSHKSMYRDVTLRGSLAPQNFSWLDTRSASASRALEHFMEHGEEEDHTPPFDHVPVDHGLEMFDDIAVAMGLPTEGSMTDDRTTTRDAMETDMQVLTELNIRAYRLMTGGGTSFTEELCAMTQSVLKVLAQITATAREQQNGDCREKEHQSPRTSISLVLQAVSVCEQIYSAFIHVCTVLHNGLEIHADLRQEADADDRMSDAQAVMTVELINYLFEKLSRAQKRLLDTTFAVENASPRSVESLRGDDSATSPKPSLPSDTSSDYSSPTGIITIMKNRTFGKHPQLQNAIQTIRDLTRDKDGI